MENSDIGRKGEDVACLYLEKRGHTIVDRNFKVKAGEIDVVSRKGQTLFFVEVKTTAHAQEYYEMHQKPEENVHTSKMRKLSRAIQIYLLDKHRGKEVDWKFWVIAITLDMDRKRAFVKVIPETIMA